MTVSYGWAAPTDYFALMERDSNHSARLLEIGSSRTTCTPCSRRRLVASGQAFETIPAMAWIAGPDDDLHFLNRRWVEYTGLSQVEKPKEIRKVAIHPDDLDRIERRLAASFASGELFEEELRIRRTDGEYRWFLSRTVPLRDKRGKVVKWYGTATDIQDRKRAEQERERLRYLEADLAHINRVSTLGEMAALSGPRNQAAHRCRYQRQQLH